MLGSLDILLYNSESRSISQHHVYRWNLNMAYVGWLRKTCTCAHGLKCALRGVCSHRYLRSFLQPICILCNSCIGGCAVCWMGTPICRIRCSLPALEASMHESTNPGNLSPSIRRVFQMIQMSVKRADRTRRKERGNRAYTSKHADIHLEIMEVLSHPLILSHRYIMNIEVSGADQHNRRYRRVLEDFSSGRVFVIMH